MMKKILKNSVVIIFLMSLLTSFGTSLSANSQTEYINYEGFTYTVSDNEATVTGYTGDEQIKTIYIPSYVDGIKVTAIGAHAFSWNTELENVVFQDDSMVKYIGENAFAACVSLKTVNLPICLKKIDDGAFQSCAIESISLYYVDEIGKFAFLNCKLLKDVKLPIYIETIQDSAFAGCSSLDYISFPDGVNVIGKEAFFNCSSLDGIILPDSVEKIDDYAFYGCVSLSDLYIGEDVTYIGKSTFENCGSLVIYGEEESQIKQYTAQNRLRFITLKTPEIKLVGATKLYIKAESGFVYRLNNGEWQQDALITVSGNSGGFCTLSSIPIGKTNKTELLRKVTFSFDGQDTVPEMIDVAYMVSVRTDILTDGKNMANDYNSDGSIDILDLVGVKKKLCVGY